MRGTPRRAARAPSGGETAQEQTPMDQNRLDRLAQTLADPRHQSRRGVLVAMGAALIGALVGVAPEAADATPRPRRHPTPPKGPHTEQRATRRHAEAGERQRVTAQ